MYSEVWKDCCFIEYHRMEKTKKCLIISTISLTFEGEPIATRVDPERVNSADHTS